MSKPTEMARNYQLADAVMIEAAKTTHGFLNEDLQDFNNFNPLFEQGYADDWLADINTAESVTKDDVVIDQMAGLSAAVEAAMKKCRDKFNTLKFFIEKAFPTGLAIWNEFGYNNYERARQTQSAMIQFMVGLHAVATKYKVQLIAVHFTQAMIDEILTFKNELDTANLNQELFKAGRPALTQDRIIKLNQVWDILVEVGKAGKIVYSNNHAKYNRYLLPGETPASEEEVPPPPPTP